MLELKFLRLLLNTLYELQKTRALVFLYKSNNIINKKNIIKTKELINLLLTHNAKYEYLNNFSSLIQQDEPYLNTNFFTKYTEILIYPIIKDIKEYNINNYLDKEFKKYIKLIQIIERISFQNILLKDFYLKDNKYVITLLSNILIIYTNNIKYTFNLEINIEKLAKFSGIISIYYTYTLINKYINILKDFENYLYKRLINLCNKISNNQNFILFKNLINTDLSEESITLLLTYGKFLNLNKYETLNYNNNFYICLSGSLKATLSTEDGTEAIIDLLSGNSCFYGVYFVNNTKIEVLQNNTCLFVIKNENLEYLRNNYANISDFIFKMLINSIIEKNVYIENIIAKKVKARLAYLLLKHKVYNEKIKFSKYNIARYLNMRPETFSRSAKDLKHEKTLYHDYLCKYCTIYLSKKCNKKNLKNSLCPYN